ncbi:15388_t:CDS:2, partial [Racocetra persica]
YLANLLHASDNHAVNRPCPVSRIIDSCKEGFCELAWYHRYALWRNRVSKGHRIHVMVERDDIPKTYSVLNLLFWHNHARSSLIISSLILRDPYTWKRLVCFVNELIPFWIYCFLRFDLVLPFIGPLAELIAHWLRHQGQVKEFGQDNTNILDNE